MSCTWLRPLSFASIVITGRWRAGHPSIRARSSGDTLSPAHWGSRLGRDAIYLSVLVRHQARHRVSRPVRGMLAAVRALPPASRWHLGRRADARRRVDAPIAPQGIENPREAPRKGHDRPQLAAPLREALYPPSQRGPRCRPTAPVGPRGCAGGPDRDASHTLLLPTPWPSAGPSRSAPTHRSGGVAEPCGDGK